MIISAAEAKRLMDTETDYIILDVRTQQEYDAGRIGNPVHIPLDTLGDEAPRALPDKSQLILVYCHNGYRSAIAAQVLERMGYTNVKNFDGVASWPYGLVQ